MRSVTKCVAAAAALVAFGTALSATPPDPRGHSADLLPRSGTHLPRLRSTINMAAPMVTDGDVGDADSFGKKVIYEGLAQSGQVVATEDCSVVTGLGPDDRCVTINPQPAVTTFDFTDLGRMTLPAKSTADLLCFHATTFESWDFVNGGASPDDAQLSYSESVTIENDLLDDPSLVDPTTGAPFNGSLTVSIGPSRFENMTLQPGADISRSQIGSRTCIGGAISKKALSETYGLPDSIVDKFFKQPITIRLNLTGRMRLATDASLMFGVRFYGD
jgi:hypothetical protein